VRATFRPLPVWPHEPTPWGRQRHRPFKASWSDTLTLLEREVLNLRGRDVIIGAGFTEHDIRMDGMPRSDAKMPRHAGVELSFDSKHGRLTYATDVCDYWQHNVRSIALGLEALRAVDRYGVSTQGQQYAGYRALPGIALSSGVKDDETAWRVLREAAGVEESDGWDLDMTWREAARNTHPDHGGEAQDFARVKAAYDWLRASAA
jgi:hypothetical protein